jgi:hypothetical protein
MGLFLRVLDFVFGCHHSNLSKVFTIDCRTYRVCFGCGSTFDYSLETMSWPTKGSVVRPTDTDAHPSPEVRMTQPHKGCGAS